uniref:Methyltransferase n=1 Tax=Macrostomum lignano TaxID=282301 RepID=A0A1I8FE16_9PLAT
MVITASSRAALRVLLLAATNSPPFTLLRLFEMFQVGRLARLELMTAGPSQCPARRLATQLSLPVHAWQPTGFQFDQFDIGVVASFGRFIPASVLHSGPLGAINRIRQGGVLLQRRLELAGDETAPMLVDRLAGLGCDCLEATLDDLPAARRAAVSQADLPYARSLAKRPDPTFAHLDWSCMSAGQVEPDSPGSRTRLAAALSHRIRRNSSRTSRSPRHSSRPPRVNLGQASELPGQIRVDLDSGLMLIGCSDGGWAGFTSLTRAGKPKLNGQRDAQWLSRLAEGPGLDSLACQTAISQRQLEASDLSKE